MVFLRRIFVMAIFLLFLPLLAESKVVRLFHMNGAPLWDLAQTVRKITPGDTLIFGHGQTFQVREYLGQGDTTVVYALDAGRAIRVPLMRDTTRFINSFVAGLARLKDVDPRFYVKLYDYRKNQYAIVERIARTSGGRLDTFLGRIRSQQQATQPLSAADVEKLNGLIEFADAFALLASVGDFGLTQVWWNGTRWVLLDIAQSFSAHNTRPAMAILDTNIFDSYEESLPSEIFKKIIEHTRNIRRNMGLPVQNIRTFMSSLMNHCLDALLSLHEKKGTP